MKKILLLIIILAIILTGCFSKTEEKKDEPKVVSQQYILIQPGSFNFERFIAWQRMDTHKVNITYSYYMSNFQLTFDDYDAYCTANSIAKPNSTEAVCNPDGRRGKIPVFTLSYFQAIKYCNYKSTKDKLPLAYNDRGNFIDESGVETLDITKVKGWRLPTEAEWKFADRVGNYDRKYGKVAADKLHEVGTTTPNELGLYDMQGNDKEWVSDGFVDAKDVTAEENNRYYQAYTGSAQNLFDNRLLRRGIQLDSNYGKCEYNADIIRSENEYPAVMRLARTNN